MLYENYYKKTLKWANILSTMYRYRVIISAAVLFLIACICTFMGIYGLVYDTVDCPSQITYGEQLNYAASGLFTRTTYEYYADGEWTSVAPKNVGTYLVRSVSKNIFGGRRYGTEYTYTILPKEIQVSVLETKITYGETPTVQAELNYSDVISCSEFTYADYTASSTEVQPVTQSIVVYNSDGEEVTSNYAITSCSSTIAFSKRSITITVGDCEYIYDNQPHTYSGYEISSGSLAFEEQLIAEVKDSIISVGQIPNALEFTILHDAQDVSSNYSVNVISGELTVTKRPLYISTSGGSWVYDGEEHFETGYTLEGKTENSGLLSEHKIEIVSYTNVVNAGTYKNYMSFNVYEGEEDVTSNYYIYLTAGTLTVDKREITVETGSGSWVYDGAAHSCSYFTADNLVEGHFVTGTTTAKITNVGSISNEYDKSSVVIYSEDSTDVTDNYSITYEYGTLTVTPRPIIITSESNSWEYDGEEHYHEKFTYEAQEGDQGLVDGQLITVVDHTIIINVLQTETDKIYNVLGYAIYNGEENVTQNYQIEYEYGKLEITTREIVVTADSAEKVYDGTALTCETVSADRLVSGHLIAAETSGSQIDVGENANKIVGSVVVYNENNEDTTYNYKVTGYEVGTLTVTPRPITIISEGKSWEYDGEEHFCEEFTHEKQEEQTEDIGLVTGQEIVAANWATITDVDRIDNTFTITIYDGEEDVTQNYQIEYEYGTLEITPRSIVVTAGSDEKVYDGTTLTCDTVSVDRLVSGHTFTAETNGSQTNAGESFNVVVGDTVVILDVERDITQNYSITYVDGTLTITKRPITITSESNSWEYDGKEHYHEKFTHEEQEGDRGLVDGQSVTVVDHTIIINVLQTETGKIDNVLDYAIYNGEEDVTQNYEIEYIYGTLEITPREIVVTADSAEKVYDGTALICETVSADRLVEGHTIIAETSGSQTNVGESLNKVVEGTVVVYNESGEDITYNYTVTGYEDGTLTISPRPITITSKSASWEYDGEEHYHERFTYEEQEDDRGLVIGHTITVISHTVIINVVQTESGTIDNVLYYKIYNGDEEVTQNYQIEYAYGTLEITPRSIVVTAGSDEKVYDGTPITCDTVYADRLVEGHTIIAETSGSQTNAGDSPNKVVKGTIVVYNESGEDITYNYTVTEYIDGTLTVTPRPITITSESASWEYDGEGHYHEEFTYEEQKVDRGLISGQLITVVDHTIIINVLQTETGKIDNVLDYAIYNGEEGVAQNYEIEYIYGTLEITPREIVVTAGSAEKVYDGTALICETVSADRLVEGHTITAETSGSQTNVGESLNKVVEGTVVVCNENGEDITYNYTVTEYIYGTLTVTPRPITITSGSYSWVYDGTSHSYSYFTADNLVEGHFVTGTTTASITNVGSISNEYDKSSVAINSEDLTDVTDNYSITYEYGMLTIMPRPITITSDSYSWVYDGAAHSCNYFTADNLVEGHFVTGTTTAKITNVGSISNEYDKSSVVINSEDSTDVTDNYSITYEYGTLTVTPRPIIVTSESNSWEYDGEEHYHEKFTYEEQEVDRGLIPSQTVKVADWATITNVSEIDNTFVVTIYNGEENVTQNYEIEYIYGTLEITPREIVVTADSAEKVYDGTALTCETVSADRLVEGHAITAQTSGSQINVGESVNSVKVGTVVVCNENGEDITYNYTVTEYIYGTLTVTPRPITITSGSYSWVYDGTSHSYSYFTADNLVEGHFVTGTTTASITNVGSISNEYDKSSVAINSEDLTDVTDNYSITYEYGMLTIMPRPITITSDSNTWVYDGTAHSQETISFDKQEDQAEEIGLVTGQEIVAANWATITNVGDTKNTFTVIIYSGGEDVTDNYSITYEFGTLTVTKRPITITTRDGQKYYDGTALTCKAYDVSYGSLAANQTINITFTGTQTEVGQSENSATVVIKDSAGNDVTDNYSLTVIYGSLTVNYFATVTIRFWNVSYEYDGDSHCYDEDEVITAITYHNGQTEGYTFAFTNLSTLALVQVGTLEESDLQTLLYTMIRTSDGVDMAAGIEVEFSYDSLLVITERQITITAGSYTKAYDGTALEYDSYSVTFGSLADGDYIYSCLITGTQTEAGSGANVISNVMIYNAAGEDVTESYHITYVNGVLTVT